MAQSPSGLGWPMVRSEATAELTRLEPGNSYHGELTIELRYSGRLNL